jgi:site-specific DNA recombinase
VTDLVIRPTTLPTPGSSDSGDVDLAKLHQAIADGKDIAVGYRRVSTKEQGQKGGEADGYSLPAQSDACKRKAESIGAVVVAEFSDKSTGTNTNRPGLHSLFAFVAQHPEVSTVIVHKLDRLARDRVAEIQICMTLKQAGITLVSASENIDETPTGRLLHGIMSAVAEFYSRNLAAEVVKGSTKKAEQGGTPGRAPLGYLNVRVLHEGWEIRTVAVDPDRGHLMAWAFNEYATGGWTLRDLLEELTSRGLTSLPGRNRPSKPLTISQLHRLLSNPYFRGTVTYRGVTYEGSHEPLVSAETWNQVQAVLKAHAPGEKQRHHHHYLKGSVWCGHCGSRLIVHRAKNRHGSTYEYFMCIGRHQKRTSCDQQALPIDYIETLVEDHYRRIQLQPGRAEKLRTCIDDALSAHREDAEREQRQQQTRQAALEDQRRKLLQLYYSDLIAADLFAEEQERITRELDTTKQRLDATAQAFVDIDDNLTDALKLAQDCHQLYLTAGPRLRRQLNQAIFKALYIGDDHDGTIRGELAEPFALLLGDQLTAGTALATPAQTGPDATGPAAHKRDSGSSGLNPSHAQRVGGLKETHYVEVRGFEPLASSMRPKRSSQLSYTPRTVPGRDDNTSVPTSARCQPFRPSQRVTAHGVQGLPAGGRTARASTSNFMSGRARAATPTRVWAGGRSPQRAATSLSTASSFARSWSTM